MIRKAWVVSATVVVVLAAGGWVASQMIGSGAMSPRDIRSPEPVLLVKPGTVTLSSDQQPQESASMQSTPHPSAVSTTSSHFGTFVSEVPASASELEAAKRTIDEVAAAGLDIVYQYSFVQGTAASAKQYLDYAQSKGVKVIIYLGDLYDNLDHFPQGGGHDGWLSALSTNFQQKFSSNDDVVRYVVKTFESHPAVWGFSTSDERPEDEAGLPTWKPILLARYALVKSMTQKPVLLTMMGDQPSSFFAALRGSGDEFSTDYYPIGNGEASEPTALTRISTNALQAGWKDPWAVLQAFTMTDASYGMPGVARNAHFPSPAELVQMGQQAHAGGARNVLFFAWGAVQTAHQQDMIKAVVNQLRPVYE